ncbi:MAG: M23 family metallopeptidase [Pseudomonadota bacterium]|nr:M23 family metallopeptidase [Pseudomonadota bacterium]
MGRTDPGAQVRLDDQKLQVDGTGRFIFGFGRDAKDTAELRVIFPNEDRSVRRLSIKQRKYSVQRIQGLPRRMVTPPKAAMRRIHEEAKSIRKARAIFTPVVYFAEGLIWPTKGKISGVYGSQRILNGRPRRPHLGVDIAALAGTPVLAAAAGIVTLAQGDLYFTGGTVIINHGHGLTTVYSHLQSIGTRVGALVSQGQDIGTVGSTGRSTGPHLDWRVNWFQERLDPMLMAPPVRSNVE